MHRPMGLPRATGTVAPSRHAAHIDEFRRRRTALEEANRRIALVGMQEGRGLTLVERRAIAENQEQIRGIRETLRVFGEY